MSAVGRRYANALAGTLAGTAPEKVLGDLEAFGSWLRGVPALRAVLVNPGVPGEVKVSLLEDLGAKAGFASVSQRFVRLVAANKRLDAWADIVTAFTALCDEQTGVVRAKVTTARPLDEKTRAVLMERLEKVVGRRVELETGVVPELLGGMELRMGSTVYDGSVAGALRSMHRSLVKG